MSIPKNEIRNKILESLTLAYILIDHKLNPLYYNKIFTEYFNLESKSNNYFFVKDIIDRIDDVFKTGNESAVYINHNSNKTLKLNFTPILSDYNTTTEYVLCLISEDNNISNWQKEFNLLFEKVPNYISIIDKNFKIIRSNEKYRDTFGDNHSVFRTDTAKKRAIENNIAPAAVSFNEGIEHIAYQVAQTKSGMKCHLIVNSLPLSDNLVMEIATDITELNQLQEQLHQAHDFYTELIEKSRIGIIGIDEKGKVQIVNGKARAILDIKSNRKPSINQIVNHFPDDFFKEPDNNGVIIENLETEIKQEDNSKIPVRINSIEIMSKKNSIGRVAYIEDLTYIQKIKDEKRLAQNHAANSTFAIIKDKFQKNIDDNLDNFLNFEKELVSINNEDCIYAWHQFKFKYFIAKEISSTFMELMIGYAPNFQVTNIEELIRNEILNFTLWADNDKIKITIDKVGNLHNINTDPHLFRNLILILLKGSLLNSKKNTANPFIDFKIENNGKYLLLELIDNGPKVEDKHITTITEIQEIDNLRYGMLMLNQIVQLCGGSILIQNNSENLNELKIVLPL